VVSFSSAAAPKPPPASPKTVRLLKRLQQVEALPSADQRPCSSSSTNYHNCD
jgi:hypothetical protein